MIWNLTRDKVDTAIASRLDAAFQNDFARGKREGWNDTRNEFAGLTAGEARKRMRELRKEVSALTRDLSGCDTKRDHLGSLIIAAEDLTSWSTSFLTFQKPQKPVFAELRQAVYDGAVLDMHDLERRTLAEEYESELFADANVFIVEHDWWSAISRAEDFESGSFRLPFDVCIFEFQISNKSVIALAVNYGELAEDPSRNEVIMQIATKSLVGWTLAGTIYSNTGGEWKAYGRNWFSNEGSSDLISGYNLIRLIGDQIKAACIALEADVAISNVIRVPAAGCGTQAHEQLPSFEYRTISLRRKTRAPEMPGGEGKKGRRLHFRRGHWRHLLAFKTWVRWTMVGDPDLGFIEKEYRL